MFSTLAFSLSKEEYYKQIFGEKKTATIEDKFTEFKPKIQFQKLYENVVDIKYNVSTKVLLINKTGFMELVSELLIDEKLIELDSIIGDKEYFDFKRT